ncbi:MAG: AsmA family protein [Pseudomonadota bacterium]
MRWIIRIFGVLIGLVVLAFAALFLLPTDRIAGLATDRFEAETGRSLAIAGPIRPQLWPALGIRAEGIEVSGAEWSDRGPLLKAEALDVAVDWGVIRGDDIRVTGVEIVRPDILLEIAPDGRANWDLGTGSTPADTGAPSTVPASAAPVIGLDGAVIRDGRIRFVDASGAVQEWTAINAQISESVQGGDIAVKLDALSNDVPVTLAAQITDLDALIGGQETGLVLRMGADATEALFDGRVSLGPTASGALSANLGPDALARAAGAGPLDLPQGLGAERISLAADLDYGVDTLSLGNLDLSLDQNRVTGNLSIELDGERPFISATLFSEALDLAALGSVEEGNEGGGRASAESPEGWSTDPIDVSALGLADADIALTANSLVLPQSAFGRTELRTRLDDRRAVTDIIDLTAYDGDVTGQFIVNGRGGLSARADLAGSAIAIARLFSDLFDYDRLISLGDMEIDVLASGPSMDALLNSMNGGGSFRFGAGELLGLDIVGALRNLDVSALRNGASTIFDEITGTFDIENGVVTNTDLNFTAPLLTATGAGEIGLGGQTLDYRFLPTLRAGGEEVTVPLHVSGSWSSPKFRLDLEYLAQKAAEEELERVQNRVEREIEDEVRRELNIQGGQSAEDALRDRLENEAGNALRNLLGR